MSKPPGRRRSALPIVLIVPCVLAALLLAAPWPLHRLAENGLLPGGVIEPYATIAVWSAGTAVGDWLVWWLDCAADGHL